MEEKEKIAKVVAGKSIRQEGSLSFSCPKVELSVKAGESVQGSFTVSGRAEGSLLGAAVTQNLHMHCLTFHFKENPSEIQYCFDSTGLDEGECVRGEFKIMSNQGEYTLPYMVTIVPKIFETSLGQMKNLFHFANLAKTNWQEAVRIFYAPDFEKVITGNDRQYLSAYRALRTPPEREQHVEEFLLCVRKKQRVEYSSDKEKLDVAAQGDMMREVITLTRSGWGYTKLLVETEGDFLQAEKSVLTDDDFLGNQCKCAFLICRDKLHAGHNLGKIRLANEYVSLEIPVCVSHIHTPPNRRRRSGKRKTAEIFLYYLLYHLGRISKQNWLNETERIVSGMEAPGRRNPAWELMQAHIMLTRERRREAQKLLQRAGELIGKSRADAGGRPIPEVWCYYLYLQALVKSDEAYIRNAVEEIRGIYRENQTNWRIAWLLLYLNEEYSGLSQRWLFLEQQFEKGCRSPVWYLEAAVLVRKNPALLMKLTPFVVQTLNFMAKYDYLTDECIGQIHYLSGRLKHYSERMYDILRICYEKKRDTESLRALCTLLMKGNKTGPAYASWYKKGIEKELWLTRLYEYYILSIDPEAEEEIPAAALRYFSYSAQLPYERAAYLYAYVEKKREEYPDLYGVYLPQMERFLSASLEKGRMNRNIAFLFCKLLQSGILGREWLAGYADRLFVEEVELQTDGIQRVIVIHGKLREETVCPLRGRFAYVPVYDQDNALVFEGTSGMRYVSGVSYKRHVLFYPREILSEMLAEDGGILSDHVGVLLYQCEHNRRYTLIDQSNEQYARLLRMHVEISDSYRSELGMKLLRYYEEKDMPDEMDELLTQLTPELMSSRERTEVLRCMIVRGMYGRAYDWIQTYGAERLHAKAIARLCSRLLAQSDFMEVPSMTILAHSAFAGGKYDERILHYLACYFRGTTKEMLDLWSACERFESDSYEVGERLLLQMLFTGEHLPEEIEIFRRYLEGSADESVTDCYLEHFAYEYFICGKELPDYIWRELIRRQKNEGLSNELCELALLSYFSKKTVLQEEERSIVKKFLENLVLKKGIVFAFFRKFADIDPGMEFYRDKTFLEYRARSDRPMTLHYVLKAEGRSGEYRTEELRSSYGGIYSRHFPLFFGESLQYYITEKKGQKETLVENGALVCDKLSKEEPADRFDRINRYIAAVSAQDTGKARRLLEEYYQMEFLAEKLFSLQ
ncbi:MAG: hypothetical protein J6C33_10130 [Lachnospiraceae bacterium]|nr:hypothetical protein [Lachnospiraceae bacterium]